MIQKIQSGYKSVTAFFVLFVPFVVGAIKDPDIAAALPEGWLKWLTVVAIPAGLAFTVWLKRNQYTVDEAAELLRRAQARAVGEKPV